MTDAKVVPLRPARLEPAERLAWVCWCECAEFKLLPSGEIECWGCGKVQNLRHFDPEDA